MSSGYSPWLHRKILYKIPGLFKVGPCGNYHLFWQRLCFCRQNEHCCGGPNPWHGGIYDFKTGAEYQPCEYCENLKGNKRMKRDYPEVINGVAAGYCPVGQG